MKHIIYINLIMNGIMVLKQLKFYYKLWKINVMTLVVILAGYKEPMDKFYESNPGLSSRIANHIDFPDYTVDELLKIAKMMLEEQQYQLTPQAESALNDYIAQNEKKNHYLLMLVVLKML